MIEGFVLPERVLRERPWYREFRGGRWAARNPDGTGWEPVLVCPAEALLARVSEEAPLHSRFADRVRRLAAWVAVLRSPFARVAAAHEACCTCEVYANH